MIPSDLASVAWLELHRGSGELVSPYAPRDGYWLPAGAWRHQITERRRAEQTVRDCKRVIRDQRRHIKSLEEQLLPYLAPRMAEESVL